MTTLRRFFLRCLAAGCVSACTLAFPACPDSSEAGPDDAITDDGGSDADVTGQDTDASACPEPRPECWTCGVDAPTGQAVCEDGQWACTDGLTAAEHSDCVPTDCGQYGGEICCAPDGSSAPIPALCPSPSQAFCEDGSTPLFQCPLPPSGCHADADCAGGATCVGPGDPPSCGACMDPDPSDTCSVDGDCGMDEVCRLTEGCFCSGPAMLCQPKCTAQSCGVGQTCDAGGRCVPAACGSPDYACPPAFWCDTGGGGATGTCERTTCSDDSDCQNSWCVQGTCWSQPGTCQVPPP